MQRQIPLVSFALLRKNFLSKSARNTIPVGRDLGRSLPIERFSGKLCVSYFVRHCTFSKVTGMLRLKGTLRTLISSCTPLYFFLYEASSKWSIPFYSNFRCRDLFRNLIFFCAIERYYSINTGSSFDFSRSTVFYGCRSFFETFF